MPSKEETEALPLVTEELHIQKRRLVTGKVRIRTKVETRTELAGATLNEQQVEVTRVPIEKVIDTVPEVRTENATTIIPVVAEVLVIEKQLALKEELHVRRNAVEAHVEVP